MGIIFEARPDVISQISSLAIKSSNAVILKGGKESINTNKVIMEIIQSALKNIENFPQNAITQVFSREDVKEILTQDKYIDLIIPRGGNSLVQFVKENTKNTLPEDSYTVTFKTSGGPESSMGVVMDIVGKTQEIADTVCALVRSRMLHCDYQGRKSTAGNLAFPFSPSDIHVGEVYEFSVFHLVKVDSLLETSKISVEEV